MRRASPLAALAACLLLATSCQQPQPDAAPATLAPAHPPPAPHPLPPRPPPTHLQPLTPSRPDPYAVPTPIDPAYAERVINRLYEINGDAARLSFEAGVVTPEARLLLESIYTEQYVDLAEQSLLREIAVPRPEVRRPPGNVTMRVEEVRASSNTCITAIGLRDLSGTLVDPPDRPGATDLVRLEASPTNPTGWWVTGIETRMDETRSDLCSAT